MSIKPPAFAKQPDTAIGSLLNHCRRGRKANAIECHNAEFQRFDITASARKEHFCGSLPGCTYDSVAVALLVSAETTTDGWWCSPPVEKVLPLAFRLLGNCP